MITIRQFVGALLEEVTKARAISDAASVQIARKYLNHDLLKGFPVPRMQIREIDIVLNFAVAGTVKGVSIFDDEEVRKNALNKLRQFVQGLPGIPDLAEYFTRDPNLSERWTSNLNDLVGRFDNVLSKKDANPAQIIKSISLTIENYFYETVADKPTHGMLHFVSTMFGNAGASGAAQQPANDYIEDQVRQIVSSLDSAEGEAGVISDLLDLSVLLGAEELEKLNPERLQKMTLKFGSSDRKWMTTGVDADGNKEHSLVRS